MTCFVYRELFCLTNRFYVAARLFSDNYRRRQTVARQHGIYLFYIIKQTTTDKAFLFQKSFNTTRKPLRPLLKTRKQSHLT